MHVLLGREENSTVRAFRGRRVDLEVRSAECAFAVWSKQTIGIDLALRGSFRKQRRSEAARGDIINCGDYCSSALRGGISSYSFWYGSIRLRRLWQRALLRNILRRRDCIDRQRLYARIQEHFLAIFHDRLVELDEQSRSSSAVPAGVCPHDMPNDLSALRKDYAALISNIFRCFCANNITRFGFVGI